MHLRNVEIFCEVVSLRSFSKAAEVHHVSQSSASQAVHQLEKRLETQLIDRSKRPFELTAAGKIYYEGCRELLEGFRQIEDQVREAKDRVTGRVRVAAIYSVGLLQMDTYVKLFEERYPEAELQLEYLHPEAVYDRVLQDAADIGLVSFPKDGGEIGCIPWLEQEMVLVVPPAHRLAGQDWAPVSAIDGEKFVGFTTELTIRRQIDRWLKQAKVSVHVVHEFDNIENIKRAVEIGAGIAILPAPTLRREWESGSLWAVQLALDHNPPDRPLWSRPLGIVHKRHKTLSTAANKFVELLHEEPETLPGPLPFLERSKSAGPPSRRQTVS